MRKEKSSYQSGARRPPLKCGSLFIEEQCCKHMIIESTRDRSTSTQKLNSPGIPTTSKVHLSTTVMSDDIRLAPSSYSGMDCYKRIQVKTTFFFLIFFIWPTYRFLALQNSHMGGRVEGATKRQTGSTNSIGCALLHICREHPIAGSYYRTFAERPHLVAGQMRIA